MDTREILQVAERLAKKYKNYNEYEDLIQEGLLAAFETISKEEYNEGELVNSIRRAMNDYYNTKRNVLSIPSSSSQVRTVIAKIRKGDTDNLSGNEVEIYNALLSKVEEIDKAIDIPEEYSNRLDNQLLLKKLPDILTDEEYLCVYYYYIKDMTHSEGQIHTGFSYTKFKSRLERAIDKLKKEFK